LGERVISFYKLRLANKLGEKPGKDNVPVYAMKTRGGVEIQLHLSLNLGTKLRREVSFTPEDKLAGTDPLEKTKINCHCLESTQDSSYV
jgi:hypothetical protein